MRTIHFTKSFNVCLPLNTQRLRIKHHFCFSGKHTCNYKIRLLQQCDELRIQARYKGSAPLGHSTDESRCGRLGVACFLTQTPTSDGWMKYEKYGK